MSEKISPFKIVVFFVVFSLVGLAFLPRLVVNLTPQSHLPELQVSYEFPQASPEVVEKMVTAPLENVFSKLSELKEIKSVSRYNQGRVSLLFDEKADMDFKKFEVAALIRQLYPKLPSMLSYPAIGMRTGESLQGASPLLVFSLNGPLTAHRLHQMAVHLLKLPLSQIKGVSHIEIHGAEDLQITLSLNEEKIRRYGLSQEAIAKKITESFATAHLGKLETEAGQQLFVRLERSLEHLSELEELPIARIAGMSIRLKDVAKIWLEEQEAREYYRVNAQNAVTVGIYAYDEVNKLQLAETIQQEIRTLKQQLPQGCRLYQVYDDTLYINKELNKIYWRSGFSILILMAFIFMANRNPRYLLVLFCGILVNMCLTTLFLFLLKISVHLYTLAGLTISFGLIVDNAIVMLDHLHKKRNRKMFRALFGASLTTIAALVLVYFLPEEEKGTLIEFAVIIALNLGLSLIVALFFTPALYSLLLRTEDLKRKVKKVRRWQVRFFRFYALGINALTRYRKVFLLSVVLAFGLPVFLLPSKLENSDKWYVHWYNKSIGGSLYNDVIRPYSDIVLGGTLRLFIRNVFDNSGYRTAEETRLYVNARLPNGITLDQMDFLIRKMEDELMAVKGVKQFVTCVYSGQFAQITITFQEAYEQSGLPYELRDRLISRSLDWGGVEWDVYGVGEGFSNGHGPNLAHFSVEMNGYNFDELEKQAVVLQQKLMAHKRIREVDINAKLNYKEKESYGYVLRIDPFGMALAGTDQAEIARQLHLKGSSYRPSFYMQFKHKQIPVHFRTQRSEDFSGYDLMHVPHHLNAKEGIILNSFGRLGLEKNTPSIHKKNRQYIRRVDFDYYGGRQFGEKYLNKVLAEFALEMPPGYSAEYKKRQWGVQKAKRQYSLLLILLIAIYFICSILFESFRQPLFIILMIPVSFIGLFLTFAVFDFYFDQGGYAAFVLLGGLVVNAAIFIVNDLNNLTNGLYNRNVLKAVSGKSIPILLTIFSTCFGLVPFLVEGQKEVFWFSLAAGTIGGLMFSLIAVFVVLPVLLFKKNTGSTTNRSGQLIEEEEEATMLI